MAAAAAGYKQVLVAYKPASVLDAVLVGGFAVSAKAFVYRVRTKGICLYDWNTSAMNSACTERAHFQPYQVCQATRVPLGEMTD